MCENRCVDTKGLEQIKQSGQVIKVLSAGNSLYKSFVYNQV